MAAARTYVDFVPSHDLLEESKKQTLVLNLPGFKKEHLRVQIDNYGRLRISGERPLEADGGSQWSRFRKDFQVPDGCDAGGIRARFEKDGVLHITMPRLSPVDLVPQGAHVDAEAAKHAAAAAAAAAEEKKRHEEDARKRHASEDQEEHASDDHQGGRGHHQAVAASGAGRSTSYGLPRDRSGMVRRLLLAVALALVGAAGLYARYWLMNPSGETAPADDATVGLSEY